MSCVFIIGMPASGKTYWGDKIAKKFNWQFIDIDHYIEKMEGRSIVSIFKEGGEGYFRTIETGVLSDIIERVDNSENLIVACGGGTAAFNDNLYLMKKTGCVLYLKADLKTLASRISEQIGNRPLVVDIEDVDDYVITTLERRRKYYEQAHYTIEEENFALSTFEEIITSCLEKH